jgi:hypothetical protein
MNAVVTVLYLAEDERGRLAGVEHELGSDAIALPTKRKAADQRDLHALRLEDRSPALQDDLVGPAGEVESRPTVEAEADRPAHRPHYSNDLVDLSDLARALDRHEIHNFTDALVAKKPRHQDVAVRHVHLFVLRLVETGDAE